MAIKIKNKGDQEPEDNEGQQGQEGTGIPPAGQPGGNLDGFERVGFQAAAWIEDNRGLFFALVGAVVVAALGIVLGVVYVRSQQVEASDRLSEGLAAYEHVVEGETFLELFREQLPDVREPSPIFESADEKWEAVYAAGEHTLDDFDRGPIAVSARMVKGAAALNLGNYEEAEQFYRDAIADNDATDEVLAFAHMGLANSLAAQGDLSGAEEAWNEFAQLQPERQAYADFEIARMIERYGDADDARQRYEQFIENHPDSMYLDEVERRQALL